MDKIFRLYYGLHARLIALYHTIKLHDVDWRKTPDEICDGDIYCNTCNLLIWCRCYDLSQKELQRRIDNNP